MACLPCLFLPALAAGSAGVGGVEGFRGQKTWMWIFIGLSVLLTVVWIVFLVRKKNGNCSTCNLKKFSKQ